MAKELTETSEENAQGPAEVSGDSGSMKQHPLKDQVEADRCLKSRQASQDPALGVPAHIVFAGSNRPIDKDPPAPRAATRSWILILLNDFGSRPILAHARLLLMPFVHNKKIRASPTPCQCNDVLL